MKKEGRGSFYEAVDIYTVIGIVRWYEKKPTDVVFRWPKKES